jgi:4'-phosphopantetheinyl transferase
LIAFTAIGEVGIDVEAIRSDIEGLDIASANFTRNEVSMIAAEGSTQQQAALFLRLWTRKEAVLKASGGGLLQGLDTIDVSEDTPSLVNQAGSGDASGGSCWLVRDIEGIGGFAAAIAAPPGDWSMREWSIRCDDAIHRFVARFPGAL